LKARGWEIEELPVNRDGVVAPEDLSARLDVHTKLVAVMAANNETGAIQPVAELAAICQDSGVIFLSDHAQAAGKITFPFRDRLPDLLTISAHKLYGPMGIGALVAAPGLPLRAIIYGGHQERGLRPGTVPLALAVGFGRAAVIASEELQEEAKRLRTLSEKFWKGMLEMCPETSLVSPNMARLPGTLNFRIPGVAAEDLLLAMPRLHLASGAACASGRQEPSHVLAAQGLSPQKGAEAIRLGLGRFTSEQEIEESLEIFRSALSNFR
ncbi:MAG: aminotransferase class V-fold PLP-dependent enzyme, partial [Kiloniellales bacterium]|nr:aminotransferase class V-fold PLP-dependent enzyme [Kiloniellales bacterium]